MAVDGLTEFQGPWWGEAGVMQALGLTPEELRGMRNTHRLLAVVFSDGKAYYPARQFMGSTAGAWQVVAGLQPVLDTLAAGIDSPDTWATWLAGEFETGITVWEALAAGRVHEVVLLAHRDVASWTGP